MIDLTAVKSGDRILANTDMLMQLMAEGHTLRLPSVSVDDPFVLEHFTDDEISHLNLDGDMNDIVSIEYVGEMPVQCISIDDPEHLYLTDDFIPTHNTSNIVFLKSTVLPLPVWSGIKRVVAIVSSPRYLSFESCSMMLPKSLFASFIRSQISSISLG